MGGFQGLLPGSVSKYCLQHSPVPVIVVRPSSKRDKARNKRALDPNRHAYKDLLEKSSNVIDTDARNVYSEESRSHSRQASEDEAAAVAAAIGYRPKGSSPLVYSQTMTSRLDATIEDQNLKSPGVVMKSPELQNLDSPEISDSSSSEDEDEDEGGVPTESPAVGLGVDEHGARKTGQAEEEPRHVPEIVETRSSTTGTGPDTLSTTTESGLKDEVALKTEDSAKTSPSA